ncbi:BTAD domain-containing putative transcriptional regulator [Amycolatopsis sp. EV170708-02-1]|uniref:BTAD domain-containing putative transcriptional regulator n=1 Tax=Amycolatopsis sp. EV170708-02-1 TaxID=2919322 RepID=UPI001F0C8ADB|nr:BTAD domain-containing putative transcriptional regulator [Amycolatopsis sp. EV170708-02-1]UMP06000.1 winged helix-turn-helix domain-containing protein [Amycolatopsis sp. EV170708-02-1]
MEFRVLGPLEVVAGGVPRQVGSGRQRAVLTALLLRSNQVVPNAELIDMVWGEPAPRSAAVNLRGHIAGLRRALAPEGERRLAATGGGYQISARPDEVDLAVFEDLVARGYAARRAGEHADAARRFGTALRLWRGHPFDGVELHGAAAAEVARLSEIRLVLTEDHLGARLAIGDGAVIGELRGLVVVHPLREPLWMLLMRALHVTGRQTEALAAYDQARERLATELGIDPGPALKDLRQRILTGDPALLGTDVRSQAEIAPDSARIAGTSHRPLNAFVGRESELRTLARVLDERRLVTVAGPAGVGKTRLVVEHLAGREAWLVRLADVGQAAVVPQAVADGVGLVRIAGDPRRSLCRALADRSGLLVLDNCEHLVPAVAGLVTELLACCPRLSVLTTSREPLDIDGEALLPLNPLRTETAVALLVDRVRAAHPGWTPSPGELRDAARVCETLDGLPLAVELAAARANVLGLDEIAEALADRFAVLGPVPRGSLTSHATLREAIAWSIEPLPGADRTLLSRLWPFEGGFSLDAAETISGRDNASVFNSVSSLITRSVVLADTTTTPSRYRMLETIRAYCESEDPAPVATRDRHAAWMRGFAADHAALFTGEHAGRAVAALNREWPNLRAGIGHDLSRRPEAALRTVGLLDWFWTRSGHITEGRALVGEALRTATDAPTADRARALSAAANLAYFAGDIAEGHRLGGETLALTGGHTDLEHRILHGSALFYHAVAWLHTGEFGRARAAATEAITIGGRTRTIWLILGARMVLGAVLVEQGQVHAGEEALAGTARSAERSALHWLAAWAEFALGKSLLRKAGTPGQVDDAADFVWRAITRFQAEGDVCHVLFTMNVAVELLLRVGRPVDAATLEAAILHRADQLGLDRTSVSQAGAGPHEAELAGILTLAQRRVAKTEGARLDWTEMVGLARATRI